MEDVINVIINLGTKGFQKGSQEIKRAVNSLARSAKQMGAGMERGARTAMGSIKRLIPMIIGVGSAYGIISKAVSAFMSQNEELASKMNSIWTALGNLLAPIIEQIIQWVTTAVSYFLEFLRLLGITNKTASELSKKANKNNQELQKTIMGFDELNVLSDNSQQDRSKNLDDVSPSEWMKKLAELFKNKMWDDAADMIIAKMNDIIQKIHDKAYEVGAKIGEYLQGIIHVIARVLDEVDWKTLGGGIAQFLNGLLAEVDGINFGEDLGKILVAKFTIAFKLITGFLEEFDFARFGNIVSEAIKSGFDSISRAIDEANPQLIGENLASFFNNIDWAGIADSIANALKKAWDFATTLLISFLTNIQWRKLGEGIRHFFEKLWEDKDDIASTIFEILSAAWDAVLELLWGLFSENGEEPPIVAALEKIGELIGAVIEYLGSVIELLGSLADVMEPVDGFIKTIADTLGQILMGVLDEVIDKFHDMTDVLHLFSQVLSGEISFTEFVKGLWDVATGANDVKRAVSESSDAAINAITQFAEWGANSVAIMGDITTAGAHISDMKLAVDEYTESLVGNMQGQENASAAVLHLRAEMDELKTRYADMVQNCQNTTEAQQIAAQMQEELSGITSEYVNLLLDQGYSLDEIADALGRSTEEIAEQAGVQIELANATSEAAGESKVLTDSVNNMRGPAGHAKDSMQGLKTETEKTATVFGQKADKMEGDAEDFGTHVTRTIEDTSKEMSEEWTEGLEGMEDAADEISSAINDLFESNFGMIADNAYYWGWDMILNLNNGIVDGVNSMLEPTMEDIANLIRSYIGFSEPEKGPLSNFHTYGPDMMKLFAEGITGTSGKVMKAVNAVAEGVSEAINGGDYTVGANFAAMNAIGANVPFAMPAVAGGGILPYSVSGSVAGGQPTQGEEFILSATQQLVTAIQDLQSSLENMQWVAQFGNVRAVVQEITRIQRNIAKSEGK